MNEDLGLSPFYKQKYLVFLNKKLDVNADWIVTYMLLWTYTFAKVYSCGKSH